MLKEFHMAFSVEKFKNVMTCYDPILHVLKNIFALWLCGPESARAHFNFILV